MSGSSGGGEMRVDLDTQWGLPRYTWHPVPPKPLPPLPRGLCQAPQQHWEHGATPVRKQGSPHCTPPPCWLQARSWLADKCPTLSRNHLHFTRHSKVSGKICRCKGQGQAQAPKLLCHGLIPGDSDKLDTDRGLRLHWEWRLGWEGCRNHTYFHGQAPAQVTLVPSQGQN